MFHYASSFDKDSIPHITANNTIVDRIHNYKKPKAKKDPLDDESDGQVIGTGESGSKSSKNFAKTSNNHALEKAPNIKEKHLDVAIKELQHERTARLIGLITHLAYWSVFGHFNQLPLDMYHKKQLFITVAQL